MCHDRNCIRDFFGKFAKKLKKEITKYDKIPDSDLFEVGSIDDIYGENVNRMLDPGCFLAVIKRKEIVQFDSLFMIKVAESKGLFGDPNKVQRQSKHEPVVDRSIRQSSQTSARKRTKRAKVCFPFRVSILCVST